MVELFMSNICDGFVWLYLLCFAFSFGILGKPLSQFSSETLKPQEGPSEEETENEEDEGSNSEVVSADPRGLIRSNKTSLTGQRSLTTAADKHMRSSRADLVSRATTEALSSDTEYIWKTLETASCCLCVLYHAIFFCVALVIVRCAVHGGCWL